MKEMGDRMIGAERGSPGIVDPKFHRVAELQAAMG